MNRILFRSSGDIDLSLSGKHLPKRFKAALKAQNLRASGLLRRLYEDDAPGVLLADEVGKGKTHVALGVAFAVLARKPTARVLVLTHSRPMANTWQRKWMESVKECVHLRWAPLWENEKWCGTVYDSLDELEDEALSRRLPRISFTSYDGLKKYKASDQLQAGRLKSALARSYRTLGLRFGSAEKNQLLKAVVPCDLRGVGSERVSAGDADVILENLDAAARCWKAGSRTEILEILDDIQARSRLKRARFDLVIVDEAHKLEGDARHRVVSRLLSGRFEKAILVTATPFALSVDQFRRRLEDFQHGRSASADFLQSVKEQNLPLDAFQEAVRAASDYDGKDALERKLRQHMVRDAWDHDRDREREQWSEVAKPEAVLPTLLLEKLFALMLEQGGRTQIASRRESLCSSWGAAQESLKGSPIEGVDPRWVGAFNAVVNSGGAHRDPKLLTAARKIGELVDQGEKVVLFTHRLKTSAALVSMLRRNPEVRARASSFEKQAARLRRHTAKIATWLKLGEGAAKAVAKVMAHARDCPPRGGFTERAVRSWWRQHRSALAGASGELWEHLLENVIGSGRRLPIVVRYDGESSGESNLEKFNLPSSPLVLIASPKAQEGIDLHHYCRRVVLFDLAWNPAILEQRVGRVHRIGGIRKKGQKVIEIYCYQRGTYEETMVKRIQDRCKMMRVLLGAGQ